ncbi:MAG: von Willebrand factor type A domain-containing protein [Myxococcota bacterium]
MALVAAAVVGFTSRPAEPPGEPLVIPDRYIELLREPAAAAEAPDRGEGARAKRDEGKVGKVGMGSGASGYGMGGGTFGAAPIVPNRAQWSGDDTRSTFAIDVDTGAYAMARRSIREGALPHPDAVRTEEFVNAMVYDLPPPDGAAPFSVSLEGAPNPFVRGHQVLRVGLQGRRVHADRRPVHLTFLVDTSGSMRSSDRLPLAKQGMVHAVAHLGPRDTVAIVTYAGRSEVVLRPTPASDAGQIRAAVDGLEHGGGTAMADGMALAYELAWSSFVAGDENRVIVLSDGDANIGAASPEQILHQLAAHARNGVTLSTVGFGSGNYRDAMMERLADDGDGNYSYVEDLAAAERLFGEDLLATVVTIARDVKVQVEFDPRAVLTYRLLGYENRDVADDDFRDDAVDGGEIGAGHSVTALYDVVLADEPRGTLATVHLRYALPAAGSPVKELTVALPAAALQPSFTAASADLRLAFGVAAFAEKLRGAESTAEVGWDELRQVVERAPHTGPRDDELAALIARAAELSTGEVAAR